MEYQLSYHARDAVWHTAAMSRGKTLEAILQNVVIGLRADVDGLEGVGGLIDLGWVYKASVGSLVNARRCSLAHGRQLAG